MNNYPYFITLAPQCALLSLRYSEYSIQYHCNDVLDSTALLAYFVAYCIWLLTLDILQNNFSGHIFFEACSL